MRYLLVTIIALVLLLQVCLCDKKQGNAQKEQVFEEAQAYMAKEQKGRQYFRQAEELVSKKKYKEAIPLYQNAIENLETFKHVALFNLAMAYKNLKRHQDSIMTLMQVIPLLPPEKKEQLDQVIQVHRLIADQSSMLEKWDLAAYHFEQIRVLTNGKDLGIIINLARALLNWGDRLPLEKSMQLLQKLLEDHPDEFVGDKVLACDFGVVLAKLGNEEEKEECEEILTRCRADNARDHSLHVSMATRLFSSSPSQALAHLELVTSAPQWYSNPLATQVIYRLGLIYRALGRDNDERQLYQDAVYTWHIFRHTEQRPQFMFHAESGPSLPLIPWYHPQIYELRETHTQAAVSSTGDIDNDVDKVDANSKAALHQYVSHIVSVLESNFTIIRSEVQALLSTSTGGSTHSLPDLEGLVDKGYWSQVPIYRNGRKFSPLWEPDMLPALTPRLLNVVGYIYNRFAKHMPLGAIEISTLKGGTDLRPHCGPTNHKIRFHLGIQIPNVSSSDDQPSTLQVAGKTQAWQEGHVLVFDDSFEHSVHSPSTQDRVVLIVDVWHPFIDAKGREMVQKHFKYSTTVA